MATNASSFLGLEDSLERLHSAESIAVGEWAANLILKNVFDIIDEKEKMRKDMRSDTSTEGPEPEPPVDEDYPRAGRPTVTGRPIPSPLQDDPTWAGHKEDEAKLIPPAVPAVTQVTPAQSPEAGAPLLCWPQTPQSPVAQPPMDAAAFYGAWGYGATPPPAFGRNSFGAFPPNGNSFGNSFNAGFNAGFAGVFNGGFGAPAPPAQPNLLGNAAAQGWGGGGCGGGFGGGCPGGCQSTGPNGVPGYNPYAPFGSYAWHQYGGYGGFPQAAQGPQGPSQDMRQAYYPQANSQAQWTQGGQAFFQPFSTQPPVHPAMQLYAPPPAAPQYPPQQPQQPQQPPQRAPLTAQFSNGPLLNTQPFQQQPPAAYPQMPMRPAPQAPPTVAPQVPTVQPQPTVAPPQVQPMAPSQPAPSGPPVIPTVQAAPRAAKPPSPVHTKEERRQAAEEVLAQQRARVAMLSRARDESAENRPSEASTAVTTPAAAVATSASASAAELKPNEATSSAPQPASPSPSTEEPQAKSTSKASTWAPKIAPRKGGGKGGVWVAKDSSKGGGKSSGKSNGKGKGKGKGLVYRPKHEVAEVEETNERRQQKKRGKMNAYNNGY